jgi:hypothetical protein
MPAKSEKQKKFMDAAAHNPAFAKASGVPVKVAKEFSEKSKGMKFGKDTNTSRPDLQKVNKPKTLHGKMSIMKEGGNTMASKMNPGMMAMIAKKKGMSTAKDGMKRPTPMADTSMMGMKKGGMAGGGMPMKDGKPAFIGDGKGAMKHGGISSSLKAHASASASKAHAGMKNGGMSSKMGAVKTGSTPNGVASKGKTKGKMIKMNMGGRAC